MARPVKRRRTHVDYEEEKLAPAFGVVVVVDEEGSTPYELPADLVTDQSTGPEPVSQRKE
jgi:hypothetical protein